MIDSAILQTMNIKLLAIILVLRAMKKWAQVRPADIEVIVQELDELRSMISEYSKDAPIA